MATIAKPLAVHDEERAARRELAAAYRLAALMGWDDQIATHFSVRLSDGTFLLNPFGMRFEEITASSLMRVSMDGEVLDPPGHPMNRAAFTIHSAVLAARADVNCVMHLHTLDGGAVSVLEEGLLPLTQTAMIVSHDIAYHAFEGIASDLDERVRLQADLGDRNLMILRNHGTLTAGGTIAKAFYRMDFLERACSMQVRALGMGRPIVTPGRDVVDHVASQSAFTMSDKIADLSYWPAMLRKAERDCPGFDA